MFDRKNSMECPVCRRLTRRRKDYKNKFGEWVYACPDCGNHLYLDDDGLLTDIQDVPRDPFNV